MFTSVRAGDSPRSSCRVIPSAVAGCGVSTAGADDAAAQTPALVADVAHTPYPGRQWAVALPCLSTFIHNDL